jgi:hypothetical protein
LALNASKEIVSVTNTGTGDNVLATAPTLVGDVSLSTGNLVIGTSGKGIDFSATAGTGTSELLDDYEEGTWTPVYEGATGSAGGLAYVTQNGSYTKIGRSVQLNGRLALSNKGSWTGAVRISGLPFSSGGAANFQCNGAMTLQNVTLTGYQCSITISVSGTAFLNPIETVSASSFALLNTTAIANDSLLDFSISYLTA